MKPHVLRIGLLFLMFLPVSLLLSFRPVSACATARPPNEPVEIADETALIIWDAENKTQHFIRRASFKTEAENFGFLVPTPTKPDLAPASDETFTELAKITAPKVIKQQAPARSPGCGCGTKNAMMPEDRASVEVLEQKRVAGYDAAVLKASDADALAKWLKDNGYEFSPALTKWVEPYIKQQWVISAFKISRNAPAEKEVATSAVRMTFKTDYPFFPYREPPEEQNGPKSASRLLRVFFVGKARVTGTIGTEALAKSWDGKVVWSNTLVESDRNKILDLLKLPQATPPSSWWLTEFEDHSNPRSGHDDVYFSPSTDQTPVERPPHIQYVSSPLPGCLMCYALAAFLVIPCVVRGSRRRHLN